MISIHDKDWHEIFWGRDESMGELFRIWGRESGICYARRLAAKHALFYGHSYIPEPPAVALLEWKEREPWHGGTWQLIADMNRLRELFNGELDEVLMELLL